MNGETNAEASPLEILNNLIFENSEKMPNGLYLELMNQTKKIFDLEEEKKRKEQNKNNFDEIYNKFILLYSPNNYLLKNINHQYRKHLNFFRKDGFFINDAREWSILRLLSHKKNFIFLQIVKINKLSLRYNLIKFKEIKYYLLPEDRKKPKIIKNRLLYFGNNKDLEYLNFYILDEKREQTKKIFDDLKTLTNSFYIDDENNNFEEVDKIKF